jgi:hypothetical protein
MKKIRKYCIIAIDNVAGLKDAIERISNTDPKFVSAQSTMVSTFETKLSPIGLKRVLINIESGSYFIFELNPETSMVRINKKSIQDFLFTEFEAETEMLERNINPLGDVINTVYNTMMGVNGMLEDDSESLGERFFKDSGLSGNTRTKIRKEVVEQVYDENKLMTYNKEEREILINELLDKAPNLTDNDKKILSFLNKV